MFSVNYILIFGKSNSHNKKILFIEKEADPFVVNNSGHYHKYEHYYLWGVRKKFYNITLTN